MTARLKLLLSEAWRSTTASLSTTIAATLTVLAALFVLGCALALGTWLRSYGDSVKKQLLVKVYFCTDITCPQHGYATAKEINGVRVKLESNPQVKSVTFVSRDEALIQMKKKYPEYTTGLVSNPLPDSEEVQPVKGDYIPQIANSITKSNLPGIQKVNYGKQTTKKILHYANVFNVLFGIALIILLVASILLVINTIRLSIFARRREIEVMKLVGASNWFVRLPFMIEGLIFGFVGSLSAVVLLLLGKAFALPALNFVQAPGAHAIAFELNALILIGFGLLIGAIGSSFTLRRFLKV
jgi:cell division transport system permease protein